MKMPLLIFFASIGVSVACAIGIASQGLAASFDCAKATQPIETTICGNDELSSLDSALARIYQVKEQIIGGELQRQLLQSEREWLSARVTQCHISQTVKGEANVDSETISCISELYRSRIREIASIGPKYSSNPEAESLYAQGKAEYDVLHYADAVGVWKKAAELRNTKAMNALGDLYEGGIGVPVDHRIARLWWTRASGMGDADAMMKLGDVYSLGQTVPKDNETADHWWMQAIATGNSSAMASHAYYLSVEKRFIESSIWYDLSANGGNPSAMLALCGNDRLDPGNKSVSKAGDGKEEWCEEGIETLWKQAGKGNLESTVELAKILIQGSYGVRKDVEQGLKLFDRVVALGDASSADFVADEYQYGGILPKDLEISLRWRGKALKLFRMYADAGDVRALNALADHMRVGSGIKKNCNGAIKLYRQSVEKQSEFAMRRLGDLYTYGNCVPINLNKARYWLNEAIRHDDQIAKTMLLQLPNKWELST